MPQASVVTLEPSPQQPAQSTGRRVVRAALALVVLVPILVFVALDWRLATAPTRIDGVFDGLAGRPQAATDGSVTILLLVTGEDQVDGPALAWMPGGPKVSSTLMVTIAGHRRRVAVDWLPMRGSVLAGLTERSPSQTVAGVESWTGRRVDHLGVVGWSVFADLSRANGGPDGLADGAGVVEQQAFLRVVLEETLHTSMRKEPWTLYRALHTVATGLAIDEDWSVYSLHRLVFSLRDLRSAGIDFGAQDRPLTR